MVLGRIYIIRAPDTEEVYIGSTTQSIERRLVKHRCDYKRWRDGKSGYMTSFELIQYEECHIELLDEVEFETIQELRHLEGEWIRRYDIAVNKVIPGRTKKEAWKGWYELNRQRVLDRVKEHNKNNKEKRRAYREATRDHRIEYNKAYRETHRDQRNATERARYAKQKAALSSAQSSEPASHQPASPLESESLLSQETSQLTFPSEPSAPQASDYSSEDPRAP